MTKRTPTPLMLLLSLTAAAFILIVLVSAATPAQAQSGLPWESIKATLIVWATQMPINQVATQAAVNGLQLPQPVYGTANALLAQMPAEAVFGTLVAPNFTVPGVPQPTAVPPTTVPPTRTPPPVIPPSATPVVPPPGGQQPPPSATPVAPPPGGQPPTAIGVPGVPATVTPVPSPSIQTGRFSGQVLYPPEVEGDSAGIQLVLTRPDGSSVTLPTRGNGVFTFSNMTIGTYILETQAQGYLTNQITFELGAGEDRMLPTSWLIAGDTNGDNRVDLNDAALVASNFNGPAIVAEVDLNEDGWIDIIDLTLVGTAFGLAGPLPW